MDDSGRNSKVSSKSRTSYDRFRCDKFESVMQSVMRVFFDRVIINIFVSECCINVLQFEKRRRRTPGKGIRRQANVSMSQIFHFILK